MRKPMTSDIPQRSTATPFAEHLPEGTELLLGQYTITKYLNSGGFGITYLAKDSLDRTVVVKECFPGAFCRRDGLLVQARSQQHVAELEAVVGLFLCEARALSKLEHPNIVGVHQVFEFNNTAYMALDFIEGRNLLQLVNSPGRSLTPRQIRSILEKLLSAVGAVHTAGLLHRDISPDNVIVTADHDPVVIDFGAAREQATKATQALSALRVVKDGYSPQEFYLAGSNQGPFSDLYSLAATFYHVITGEVPPDSQRRLSAHVAGELDPYVPLHEKTSAYDRAFCDALDRAMAILPKDRVQSADAWRRLMNEAPEPKKRSSLIHRSIPVAVSKPRTGSPAAQSRPSKPMPMSRLMAPAPKPKTGPVAKPARKRGRAPLVLGSAALALVAAGVLFAPAQTGPETATVGPDLVAATALATHDADGTPPIAPAAPSPGRVIGTHPEAGTILPTPGEEVAEASDASPVQTARIDGPDVLADLPVTLADGAVTLAWTARPPFTVDGRGVVTEVTDDQLDGLAPGWTITSVGDAPFDARAGLLPALLAAARSEDGRRATVLVSARAPDDRTAVIGPVDLPLVYTATLGPDLVVETEAAGDVWQNRVLAAPADATLRQGDELVALIESGDRLEAGDALARAVAAGAAAGIASLRVAVLRDGSMWAADLPLPALSN
jgi:serine/threonine protein kinase